MVLTAVPRQSLFLALIVVVLELAAASHFRGATVHWKAVDPANFDGRVLFTHRIAWRRSYGVSTFCNASTVSAGTLIGIDHPLVCRSGCSGDIGSLQYQCTDFSVDENWSAGQGSNEINLGSAVNFEASYTGGDWIALVQGGGRWEVRVKGNLSPRSDNGRINSSPVTAEFPIFRLQHGANHTIAIPVSDVDGDIVRCRWATSNQSECAGVCQTFPAELDQDSCILTFIANGSLGWYAAALQVEDFISSSSTTPMSSVPVQFLVLVQNITIPPGVTAPTFVGTTPADGACIGVESAYRQQITARSGGDSAIIAAITTVSPLGMIRSALTNGSNSRESYIIVTWTPSASQQGANIFCYRATDNFGLTSPQICVTLVAGVMAPELMNVVLTGFGNGTCYLSLEYNQQVIQPTVTRFVHVYRDGVQILSVDVSNSTDVVYFGKRITISTSAPVFTTSVYYLLMDSGVVAADSESCIESLPVVNSNDWVFGVTVTAPLFKIVYEHANGAVVHWDVPQSLVARLMSFNLEVFSVDPAINEKRSVMRLSLSPKVRAFNLSPLKAGQSYMATLNAETDGVASSGFPAILEFTV